MPPRPDLVSLLVANRIATAREIERALRARPELPRWLALLEASVVSAADLFAALRDHTQIPVVSQEALAAGPSGEVLTTVLAKEEALARGVLPFELSSDGRRVRLAMIDPTDEDTLRAIAQASGLASAKVFLISHSTLTDAVERAYTRGRDAGRAVVEPAGKVGQRSELEAQERLVQVLVQASLALGAALEAELARGGSGAFAREAGRLAREVGRELGHDRRRVALSGLAAMLTQLESLRRARRGDEQSGLFDKLGWAAAGDEGVLGIARALSAQSAGFDRPQAAGAAQRVVQAVTDYLAIAAAEGGPKMLGHADLDATEQLLRTSSAGGVVVDALLRVLRRELAERTPAAATSMPESPAREESSAVTAVRAVPVRSEGADPSCGTSDDRTQLVPIPTHPDESRDG